jgi:putative ABC transport system substrate-binding protein
MRMTGEGLRRRVFVVKLARWGASAAGLAALSACGIVPALTTSSSRRRRIGFLSSFRREISQAPAFAQGLRDLGYIEGQNLSVEWRFADGNPGRLGDLAAELVALQVEVIATESTPAVVAAAEATRMIPIVSGGPTRDLVDLGLAQSYASPGGNVTGTGGNKEQYGKLVDLLKETVPSIRRIGYLRNPATGGTTEQMGLARDVAQKLGLDFIELQATTTDGIDTAMAGAASAGVEGLVISADTLIGDTSGYRVVDLALVYRLPTIFSQAANYVQRGGLLGYSPDFAASHRRAAAYVDKLLNGARAADLPIEQAMTLVLAANTTTATALGITIPPDVAAQVTDWVS